MCQTRKWLLVSLTVTPFQEVKHGIMDFFHCSAVCWNADDVADVQLGAIADAMAKVTDHICCAYGMDGLRADEEGYDCIMIPGALKSDLVDNIPPSQCGRSLGLVSAAAAAAGATTGRTICCKLKSKIERFIAKKCWSFSARAIPFRVTFKSDNWEYNSMGTIATDEGGATGTLKQKGFKLR